MTYGFIGSGNMAKSIIKGMLKNKVASVSEIFVYDINLNAIEKCVDETNVVGLLSYKELIERCENIILSVKPNIFPYLLPEIKDLLTEKKPLIISIAAGISIEKIQTLLESKLPVIRVMPNINAEVLESMSALCYSLEVDSKQKDTVSKIFNSIGKTIELEENYISVFSGIAGCSPAFTYLFIESLAKGAHKNGLNKNDAVKIAAQAVMGSAKMILESGLHPNELIDKVCSPGGTTIEGICTLDDFKFQSALVHAVDSTIIKDKKLIKE